MATATMSLAVSFFIAMALAAIAHEAGHFAFSAIGKISIKLVSVGVGPVVLRGRLGKTDLELRALPVAGFVSIVPYQNISKPWMVLCLLGGPLGNCALIGLVAWIDHVSPTLPQYFRDGFGPVVFVSVIYIVVNLLPVRGMSNRHRVASDGLQIIQLLRGRHSSDHYRAYVELLRRYGGGTAAQPTAAWNRVAPRLYREEVWANEFTRGEALDAAQRELAAGELQPAEEMLILDRLITVGLVSGDPEYRSHFDEWSVRARELGPEVTTLKGSRGAALVELGQVEAGKALLDEVAAAGDASQFDLAMTTMFLSRAEHALGNRAAAQRHLTDARHLFAADSSHPSSRSLAERTASLIGAGSD
jgi:hypothetical protein